MSQPPAEVIRGALAELTADIIAATAALRAGTSLDLSGLDESVAMLCSAAEKLPAPESRSLTPDLARMVHALDELSTALRAAGPQSGDARH